MLDPLDPNQRLGLARFLCAFAWADRRVCENERRLIGRLAHVLELDETAQEKVDAWLRSPPLPEEADLPPVSQRQRLWFVQAAEALILADGTISDSERRLFARLLEWREPSEAGETSASR